MTFPKPFFQFFFALAIIVAFARCVPLTGYHTGRTNGKLNGQFLSSFNINNIPFTVEELAPFNNDTTITETSSPHLEVQASYGLSNRLDLGIRLNTNLVAGVMAKYQFLGTQTSLLAMAIGAEYGIFTDEHYFQVPLFFSIHLNDEASIYYSPRFVREWGTSEFSEGSSINYLGGNIGFHTGKEIKLAAEIGIYRSVRIDPDATWFEGKLVKALPAFGMGIVIPIKKRQTS